jgi:hypothetical protein
MDDFLAELERNISNIGSSKCWKREVGDVVLWYSPITLHGQEKVNELLSNADGLGMNIINETKRITLSFSIVGINDIDLRDFRDNVPRFPITKDGKHTKVTLDRYIYQKMISWSSQFVDDAFSVLADLVETDQKSNLKNIKFENAKDPKTELRELEARVSELRSSLDMPRLVEEVLKPDPTPQEPEDSENEPKNVMSVDFDPFSRLMPQKATEPVETPVSVVAPAPSPANPPPLDRTVRDNKGNVVQAYSATPSIPEEVIESPRPSTKGPAPVIDSGFVNRNPRFSPPSRG